MKPIFLFISLLFATQSIVNQLFVLNFKMKKAYGDPFVFNDSATQKTYFVLSERRRLPKKRRCAFLKRTPILRFCDKPKLTAASGMATLFFKKSTRRT